VSVASAVRLPEVWPEVSPDTSSATTVSSELLEVRLPAVCCKIRGRRASYLGSTEGDGKSVDDSHFSLGPRIWAWVSFVFMTAFGAVMIGFLALVLFFEIRYGLVTRSDFFHVDDLVLNVMKPKWV